MRLLKIASVLVVVLIPLGAVAQQYDAALLPPNAQPGECYTRVWVAPVYNTDTEQVLKREASDRIEIIPATYTTATEQVQVKEESERLEVVPATYKYVEETVMVKPARKKLVTVPAQYETVTEQVVDKPAHTIWKRGRGPIEKVNNSTGEIMCLVEIPATYKTVSKRILKRPATTEEREIPAEYTTVKRRVVDQPASVRTVKIPAEFRTVTVTKLATPPQEKRINIPAEYQTVTSQNLVKEGHMDWRTILCETNTTPGMVSKIQRALNEAGYSPGSIDGSIGSSTMSAVRAFQRANGLAEGGLTTETLRKLGVI
jgi:hypothetical protein